MNKPIVKVCGLKTQNTIQSISQLPADWLGFIFYDKSPRYVDGQQETIHSIKNKQKVGVFVNEELKTILKIMEDYQLNLVQLHGEESPEVCLEVRHYFPVIRALPIKDARDFEKVKEYEHCVDYFLFDTKHEQKKGGSGMHWNWDLLHAYNSDVPFLVSGGIEMQDVQRIKEIDHPHFVGVDINSKFETNPGEKDVNRVADFIKKLHE